MLKPELLLKAVNASNDGIVIAEQEGDDNILIYVNPAFERLTGYQRDDILYQDCRFLQAGDREQAGLKEIREAIQAGKPARVILRNYRKDGSLFWNELSVTPVYNDEDNLTYYIGIQKDVSEVVALRAEVEQLRKRVAQLENAGKLAD